MTLFCDYNLGKGKDGQQVLEEAKQRKLLPYSAIFIMATAENTSTMVMGAIDYQPDDYISKPFNRTVLHSRLKRLLDKKENLDAISKGDSGYELRKSNRILQPFITKQTSKQTGLVKNKRRFAH